MGPGREEGEREEVSSIEVLLFSAKPDAHVSKAGAVRSRQGTGG